LAENPHTDIEDPYIFYSAEPDKPCSGELFRRGFRQACKAVSDNPPGWVRNAREAEGTSPLWTVEAEKGKPWGEPEPGESVTERDGFEYRYRRSAERPEIPLCIDLEKRKLDFHSFRHFYASRMADRMAADKVARITGHRSKAMAEHYQSHVTDTVIAEAGRESAAAFSGILQFKKRHSFFKKNLESIGKR
jgi:hypothetical protein